MRLTTLLILGTAVACGEAPSTETTGGGGSSSLPPIGGDASPPGSGGEASSELPLPEDQPLPAEGGGLSDPPTNTLHNPCGGNDWQRIHGWLLLPHAAPELAAPDEIPRCVERYAGWVTNEADAAEVSRASVYAALAASGQCDDGGDYDGALVPGELCVLAHPELTAPECLQKMTELRSFGIATLAQVIALGQTSHKRDVPRMGAYLGNGSVECGGSDRWRLLAPEGFVDHYVAAYNAYKAQGEDPPVCKKRIVVSVALYTGIDTPGVDGVSPANGCWTYERVSKQNEEWKICNYNGTINHEDGIKWAYDDTNTDHDASQEIDGIHDCMDGVPGRGYIYMVNRGNGWPKRVTEDVQVHFAELYSGQYAIADQFGIWKTGGSPGQPMVNFGEPTTGAGTIGNVTNDVCAKVGDGGYFGVYVYPEPLRTGRMSAMVEALNACTE